MGNLLVFDVQRFCVHDGPGIRTVVFFKGCPLRCRWCQNPESLHSTPELAFHADRCQGSLLCARAGVCPNDAIQPGSQRVDRSRCQACGSCAEVCPHEALRLVGRQVTVDELVGQILADRAYYRSSGGGVTLSGGEPLLQAEGAAELLKRCQLAGLHTTIETCGAVPWSAFERVLPHADLFYYDLKAGEESLHRELTGAGLGRIVGNARSLVEAGASVVLRTPVVPGLNDGSTSLRGLARQVQELGRRSIRLLRYHRGGESKVPRLASGQPALGLTTADADLALTRATEQLTGMGLKVRVEGDGVDTDPPARVPRAGEEAAVFTDRVLRLRSAVQSATPAICIERALLVTEYFKRSENRAKPMAIQKAEALRHFFSRRSATIYDDELLVGCFSSKRVGGSLFPELHGVAVLEDLLAFHRRRVNPLRIDRKDRWTLLSRVIPFWLVRFLAVKAFPLPRALAFVFDQLSGKRYLINETGGISHFVPDYERLLRLGTSGIAAEAGARLERLGAGDGRRPFYRAVQIACDALEAMARSYADVAHCQASTASDPDRRKELERIAQACERVPRLPARTLHEAFQSLLFAQIALNLESLDNAVSPGRLDQLLQPYYAADLAAGRIDEPGARELVGCFTVKMSEIVPIFSRRITRFHGGMFNGQVVVVGGVGPEGEDVTNDLTWLFLDAMDRLRMRQPNYHVRLHADSPRPLTARVAEMLLDGSAAPSVMNDEVVVPMLEGRGTTLEEARDYSPVGCVEPVACASTYGSTDAALVNLALPLERALGSKTGGARTAPASACRSTEEVVELFRIQVEHLIAELIPDLRAIERANALLHPTPLTSMLLRGCLESGVDASAGGAIHNSSGVQGVGVADVADSLAAIERVVFARRLCDLPTLIEALGRDFDRFEHLRGYLQQAPKFGNRDPLVDRLADRVIAIFDEALSRYRSTRGGPYWAGFYSVTAHRAFGETTGALPSGRRAGEALANGLSPGTGLDRLGPTAVLGSVAGLDLERRARNGINLNLTLDSSALTGSLGTEALEGLIRGYCDQGGMQVQVNVLDPAVLRGARDNPASHPFLLVRVSGYSAYFNDLSPAMKQEIIDRCERKRC